MEATDNTTTDPEKWVFMDRAQCPVCESKDLKTIRSTRSNDGSSCQRKECGGCGHRFWLVWE